MRDMSEETERSNISLRSMELGKDVTLVHHVRHDSLGFHLSRPLATASHPSRRKVNVRSPLKSLWQLSWTRLIDICFQPGSNVALICHRPLVTVLQTDAESKSGPLKCLITKLMRVCTRLWVT